VDTFLTKNQYKLEKIINELGFATELETPFGNYSADIYIPELNIIVELDGPSHVSKKKDESRDAKIKEEYGVDVLRIKYPFNKKKVKEIIDAYFQT
jgi:very-short-patch-repair endonuclease